MSASLVRNVAVRVVAPRAMTRVSAQMHTEINTESDTAAVCLSLRGFAHHQPRSLCVFHLVLLFRV
jgi:small ligand-binding sensory domain FIST